MTTIGPHHQADADVGGGTLVHPEMWGAAPSWAPGVDTRSVDGHLLVWTGTALVVIPPLPAAVAVHLDGRATVLELGEDLAEASGLPLHDVKVVVADLLVDLSSWGAIRGIPLVSPPAQDGEQSTAPDAYTAVDARTGDEVRVEVGHDSEGRRVTTEHLPDGRRRVSTEFTFSDGDDAADVAERMAAAVMAGDRSAAELVPIDSCLGSKLRSDDSVPLVSIRGRDGKVRSVRCHDPEVEAALVAVAGGRIVVSERGPVEAFVVTPLEGQGPLRIYDGRGRRVGRPRTTGDAVAVVDGLLGVAEVRGGQDPIGPMLLTRTLAHHPDHGPVLVPMGVNEERGARRALREAGWELSPVQAVATRGHRVEVPSVVAPSGGPSWNFSEVAWFQIPATAGIPDLVARLVDPSTLR